LIDAEVARFLEVGPTRKELQKIKDELEAFQVLGLRSVSAKAQVLANAEILAGDPAFNDRSLRWMRDATPPQVRDAARRWLGKAHYTLVIQPFGEHSVAPPQVDRRVMPLVSDETDLDLPSMQEATLSNGMKIVLAERHEVPAVTMSLVFSNAGANSERSGRLGAAASLYALMNRGPAAWSETGYLERLHSLQAGIEFRNGGRDASASLSVLKRNLRPALALWERALRQPALRTSDLVRWQQDTLQSIASSRTEPGAVAARILGKALYPQDHPLAPRSDEEELVRALDTADLRAFHARWIRPDSAKLFAVGDITLAELTRELEKVFGDWKPPAEKRDIYPPFARVAVPDQPRFILVDWPGAQQTQISAGRFVLPAGSDDAHSLDAANAILGGSTTARLGQRLRVEKGWSYGISSGADGGTVQQYWGMFTSVQADRTAESVVEILDVISTLTTSHPVTDAELARYVTGQTRSLPGMFENAGAVLSAMVQSDYLGRPYDWAEGARARLNALKLSDVNRVARDYFTPHSFTWVLVGDLAKFEQQLRDLKLGAVEVRDREGEKGLRQP
jgi:zinc protease